MTADPQKPTARQKRIITGLDLAGWDAIAGALDVSIRTAQRLSQREADPLPVKISLGRARASSDALKAWAAKNARAA